jgi:uncharacterized protein YceH (UPF0502 family)
MNSNTEDIKRYFNVVAESLRSEIRLLAEGQGATNDRLDLFERRFDGLDGRLDRFEAAVAAEFKAVRADMSEMKAMIRLSFGQLDSRLTSLEGDVQSLRSRLDRLEGRSQA